MELKLPKIFTINREEWYRGKGSQTSMLLLSQEKKKCCVGFFALACGFSEDQISDVDTFEKLICQENAEGQEEEMFEGIIEYPNSIFDELYLENDVPGREEPKREKAIRQLFKKLGVKVRFTGFRHTTNPATEELIL